MTEMQEPAAQADATTAPAAAEGDDQTGVIAHFKSARRPSMPFWVVVALAILCFVVFMASASALFMFIVGVGIAFFLVPLVDKLEKRGMARWVASIVCVAATLAITLLLLGAIAVIILEQGVKFVENLPAYLDELGAGYRSMDLPEEVRSSADAAIATAQANLGGVDEGMLVAGVLSGMLGLLGGLFTWFLLPFFLFYVLKDQPSQSAKFYAEVPAPWREDVRRILTIVTGDFANYFKAELIVGSIMFLIVTAGMWIIGTVMDAPLLVEFAILLGLIALVMEMVPQIGPILSYIPALLLAIPAGFGAVAVVSVFYFVVFNIEGSILVPKIEGDIVEFSGAAVLVLIAIGFALGGMLGAIVALPLASIIRDLFRLFFDKAVQEDLVIDRPATASDPPEPALEAPVEGAATA